MKTKYFLLLILSFLLLSSCHIEINGYFSGYKKINSRYPSLLKKLPSQQNICGIPYTDSCKVLILNGLQLKDCIQEENSTVIYQWNPYCKGSYCYGLDRVQSFFSAKGISLYIVADYYNNLMKEYYMLNYPIIGVDTKYYKANTTTAYLKKFLQDLSVTQENPHRLLYFKKGKFIQSFQKLEEVP